MMSKQNFGAALLLLCGLSVDTLAQNAPTAAAKDGDGDLASLSTKAQDPLAKIISVPFLYTRLTGVGPQSATNQSLTVQPVVPFTINNEWDLITRAIIPLADNQSPHDSGLADTALTAIFSTSLHPGLKVGIGPTLLVPTGSGLLTRNTWAAGITVGVVNTSGRWVLGALAANQWNVGGKTSINEFQIQPIINYDFGAKGGWIFTSSPLITANWKAHDNRWRVPLGGGVSVLKLIDKVPMSFSPQLYYNVAGDHGWEFRMFVRVLLPQ